jgi:hypothetical protein
MTYADPPGIFSFSALAPPLARVPAVLNSGWLAHDHSSSAARSHRQDVTLAGVLIIGKEMSRKFRPERNREDHILRC